MHHGESKEEMMGAQADLYAKSLHTEQGSGACAGGEYVAGVDNIDYLLPQGQMKARQSHKQPLPQKNQQTGPLTHHKTTTKPTTLTPT